MPQSKWFQLCVNEINWLQHSLADSVCMWAYSQCFAPQKLRIPIHSTCWDFGLKLSLCNSTRLGDSPLFGPWPVEQPPHCASYSCYYLQLLRLRYGIHMVAGLAMLALFGTDFRPVSLHPAVPSPGAMLWKANVHFYVLRTQRTRRAHYRHRDTYHVSIYIYIYTETRKLKVWTWLCGLFRNRFSNSVQIYLHRWVCQMFRLDSSRGSTKKDKKGGCVRLFICV